MSTTSLETGLPPSSPLKYTIEGCSSQSSNYTPEHILVDKPDDANSRWSTERHLNPDIQESHWIMLKLEQMSIVTMITFGKFIRPHPCNISSFRVFGGLGTRDQEMHELLSGKLKDDNVAQTFVLNYRTPNAGVPFPCQYVKICPISPHGKSYNMSIWHIGLSGVSNPAYVRNIHDAYIDHKDTLALHLVLKHLRRNNFLAAHHALLEQTNIRTEHPRVTELHDALVLRGDLAVAEELVKAMANKDGLFDYCARVAPPVCVWKRIVPQDGVAPVGRGGHQLCLDPALGTIYLFGGWDGTKNLADFWSYSVADNRWTVIHEDTAAVGGPSARSCHNMTFYSRGGSIYVLGQLKEVPRAGGNPQPQRSDADFFKCTVGPVTGATWTLMNPAGVEAAGGPPSISDHQMVIDEEKNLLYVFGGRIENPSDRDGVHLYSGMYSFNLISETWSHIFNDPGREGLTPAQVNQVNIYSRTGHGMVLYPRTHEIFIIGGRRSNNKWSPDMYSFIQTPLSTQRLAFDPSIANAASAPRVCIDEELGEIYVLIWQNERDRSRTAGPEPATFATYYIDQKCWVRSEPRLGPFKASANGDVWEGLDLPRPRSAHQVVYDSTNKVFYMFGGNSGENDASRLNDLWSMKLIRPTVKELLRKALLAVRKFRFRRMCDTVPPFEALTYLQTQVSEVVDNDDEEEAAELRGLLSYLLGKTSNDDPEPKERDKHLEESERKARRELFDFLMQFVAPSEREPVTELRDIVENV